MPSLGFFGEFRPSEHTRLFLQFEYFALQRERASGQSFYGQAILQYQPTPTLTLDAGFIQSRLNLRFNEPDFKRDIHLQHGGPYFSIQYHF